MRGSRSASDASVCLSCCFLHMLTECDAWTYRAVSHPQTERALPPAAPHNFPQRRFWPVIDLSGKATYQALLNGTKPQSPRFVL